MRMGAVSSGAGLAILLVILCSGCARNDPADSGSAPRAPSTPSSREKADQTAPPARNGSTAEVDTAALAFTIIPGERIGHVQIGERMEAVRTDLGPPDSGDAAMGKAWSFWFSEAGNGAAREELGIYSSLGDSMRHHLVRQIRITSPAFATPSGLSTRSTLAEVQREFDQVQPVAEYTSEAFSEPVRVYDAVEAGIAFEIAPGIQSGEMSGRVIAIVAHRPGEEVARQYIPRHNYRLLNE